MFRTEFNFSLPVGYLDPDGVLHREGVIRLATAADEIHPLRDVRVVNNSAYLVIIVLSRVIVRLGSLDQVTPKIVEGLFTDDLDYLQDLYNRLNHRGRQMAADCPKCHHEFEITEGPPPGGSTATASTG